MTTNGSDRATALTLKNVSKSFGGIEAVANVHLEVQAGESRALIGPNGAGKSTLFNLITGEIPRDQGEIILFGQNLTKAPVTRRIELGLGRTYQISNLFSNLTVRENLFLAAWKQGAPPVGRLAALFKPWPDNIGLLDQVETVSRQIGLADKLDVSVSELSHGAHRQLELGMTLAHKPRILLLDEPMAGLSANERIFLTDLILDLRSHITVLIIEHDIDIAFRIAERVSVLHQGCIIAEGTPDEVRADREVREIYTLSKEADGSNHA